MITGIFKANSIIVVLPWNVLYNNELRACLILIQRNKAYFVLERLE